MLICDEIQTGFGRTGRMFGYQHADIQPDLVVLAKSLAGGLPLSAVVGRAAVMDAPDPGGLGGTYAGNPLACAAALAVLDLFEDGSLVDRANALGSILLAGLNDLRHTCDRIDDVRGLGAMVAMEIVRSRETREPDAALTTRILDRARERGLIVIRCGVHKNVVRLLPPLVATDGDAAQAILILRDAIAAAL
jgi:4-aminobutyrate aminotransferase/(S)-3-amino-2-methylpropionate transaminase